MVSLRHFPHRFFFPFLSLFHRMVGSGELKLTIHQDLIRISVGTEHIDDIIADFEQSFKAAAAAKTTGGKEENKEVTGGVEGDAKLVV